jgi:hypothetical protein
MKKRIMAIVIAAVLTLFTISTIYSKPRTFYVILGTGEAISQGRYFEREWPACKHIYTVNTNGGGTLRIDMSGRTETWPVMRVKIGNRKYNFTSKDGNSLHAQIPVKADQEVIVKWGVTQGEFPEFYSYRFVLDP